MGLLAGPTDDTLQVDPDERPLDGDELQLTFDDRMSVVEVNG